MAPAYAAPPARHPRPECVVRQQDPRPARCRGRSAPTARGRPGGDGSGAPVAWATPGAPSMWSLCAWVHTMCVSSRSPMAARMASGSWAASMTMQWLSLPTIQTLLSTSHSPAVEREDAGGDQPFDTHTARSRAGDNLCVHSSTTERSTSPLCILSKAASMSVRPMRSDTNCSSGKRPCS